MELKNIKGVGDKTLKLFNENNIYDVNDLLLTFPKKYIIYKPTFDVFGPDYVYFEGVISTKISFFRYRATTYAITFSVTLDNSVNVKVITFSKEFLAYKLKKGMRIGIYGKYNSKEKFFNTKKIFMDNLGFKIEVDYKISKILNSKISSCILNIKNIDYNETLPSELLDKYKLLNINEYIYKSHFPKTMDDVKEVLRRRKYEEFFFYTLRLKYASSRRLNSTREKRVLDLNYLNDFKNKLNFELTSGQENALKDIIKDLKKDIPMNRLVQGDVSSGKTIVSIMTALLMVKAGYQVAVMAPTEVLAEQDYIEFKKYLNSYDINIEFLIGSTKESNKKYIYSGTLNNEIDIVVGTHSLLNDKLKFKNLGLVIIDEQHRFGVNQRIKLINKLDNVDSLFLTATPIPRTLGLTIFSNLDISSIKSMPKNRLPITTKIIDYNKIDLLMKSIENHINSGEQAYVIVPRIENEADDYFDIGDCKELFKKYFKDEDIGILHGRMSSENKLNMIKSFKNGDIKILISTTVIEVGINVLNATMMIIMDAELFGLAQLHQLRGRVGRGSNPGYCMLVTKNPGNVRLNVIKNNKDGFKISEEDFKLRGPGDYLGDSQSGFEELEYASFSDDIRILECASMDANRYLPMLFDKENKLETFKKIIDDVKIDKMN